MKIIVTHMSPDWDAITSVWLLKKYLAGWQEAEVKFVPAGQRLGRHSGKRERFENPDFGPVSPASTRGVQRGEQARMTGDDPIERIGDDEIIHVDTGLGPLDHHQTQDTNVCGASLTWNYILSEFKE